MPMPRDEFQTQIQENLVQTWRQFVGQMEESLKILDREIGEAEQMTDICTSEWCEATEHVIDDLNNALFSIHEPKWSSEEDSRKIKAQKKWIRDIYARYKSATNR